MSFKVVRDAQGTVLAAGPDEEGFQPNIPAGATKTIEDAMPAPPPPSKEQQIAALLAQYGIAQEWQLDRDIGYAQTLAQLGGITEPQIYAANLAYRTSKDLKTQINLIRGAP